MGQCSSNCWGHCCSPEFESLSYFELYRIFRELRQKIFFGSGAVMHKLVVFYSKPDNKNNDIHPVIIQTIENIIHNQTYWNSVEFEKIHKLSPEWVYINLNNWIYDYYLSTQIYDKKYLIEELLRQVFTNRKYPTYNLNFNYYVGIKKLHPEDGFFC